MAPVANIATPRALLPGRSFQRAAVSERVLTLFGTLGEGTPPASTASLLEAVAAAAPNDAEIAWYRATHCPKDSDCDRELAIGRLLELEPDNLDGWLMALDAASQRREGEAALQALLERAARATYYDSRTGETFLRLYRAMHDLPLQIAVAHMVVVDNANRADAGRCEIGNDGTAQSARADHRDARRL